MRQFDGIFMFLGVLCTIVEGTRTLGAQGSEQAGDLPGRGEGSAHRMGGWNVGTLGGLIAGRSGRLARQSLSETDIEDQRRNSRGNIQANARWRRHTVCVK